MSVSALQFFSVTHIQSLYFRLYVSRLVQIDVNSDRHLSFNLDSLKYEWSCVHCDMMQSSPLMF